MLADLLDLVWPVRCVGCGASTRPLCPSCVPSDPVQRRVVGGLTVAFAGRYDAALRAALLAYKERGRGDLRRPLAGLLRRAYEALPPGVLVPVPSSRAALRRRGHDHVRGLASASGGKVVPALRLVHGVHDSAGLSAEERASNLAGAMAARPPTGSGATCIVVDDIVTTGATVLEAARALRRAGWTVTAAAAVAGTQLRRPPPTPQPPGL